MRFLSFIFKKDTEVPMIRLDVKQYCHDCANFEADVKRTLFIKGKPEIVVQCEFKDRCDLIKEYIENKKEATL